MLNLKRKIIRKTDNETSLETKELHRIIQLLCSSMDLKKVLKAVSIVLLRLTDSNACDIFLIDERNIKCVYSYGK